MVHSCLCRRGLPNKHSGLLCFAFVARQRLRSHLQQRTWRSTAEHVPSASSPASGHFLAVPYLTCLHFPRRFCGYGTRENHIVVDNLISDTVKPTVGSD